MTGNVRSNQLPDLLYSHDPTAQTAAHAPAQTKTALLPINGARTLPAIGSGLYGAAIFGICRISSNGDVR